MQDIMDNPKFKKYKCLIDALDNNGYTYDGAPDHIHGGFRMHMDNHGIKRLIISVLHDKYRIYIDDSSIEHLSVKFICMNREYTVESNSDLWKDVKDVDDVLNELQQLELGINIKG